MERFSLLVFLLLATAAPAQNPAVMSRDAVVQVGEAMATAYNERDVATVLSLMDARAFAMRVAKAQGLPDRHREEFARAMQSGGLEQLLKTQFQMMETSQGVARFMGPRASRPNGALVRLELGKYGFDYLEFILVNEGGKTRAVDWFQLSAGELISDTLGGISQLFVSHDPNIIERLMDVHRVDRQAFAHLRRAGELRQAGKHKEAFAELRELPYAITNQRPMLIVMAKMAVLAEEQAEYDRILSRMAEQHADDPSAAFALFDHYFTIKDRPKMLKAIEVIEKQVGVDAVTCEIRAAAFLVTNDAASSLKYAEQSIRLEPDRMSGFDARASALIGLGRYPEAVAQYRELEKNFGLQFNRDIFAADPFFASFMKSPAFREWLGK